MSRRRVVHPVTGLAHPFTGIMCLWLGGQASGEPRWFQPMPWLWEQHVSDHQAGKVLFA